MLVIKDIYQTLTIEHVEMMMNAAVMMAGVHACKIVPTFLAPIFVPVILDTTCRVTVTHAMTLMSVIQVKICVKTIARTHQAPTPVVVELDIDSAMTVTVVMT